MTVAPRKLYQQIADALGERIQRGDYPVGSRLPTERDLAEEFAVSRPTIREAMIALDMRAMIEARQGSGIFVIRRAGAGERFRELDVGAFELIEARVLFEAEAAALAATEIDAATLRSLAQLVDRMEREPDQTAKVAIDRDFHLGIAAATANSVVHAAIEMLWNLRERSPLCIDMFERARREGVEPREQEHRLILDALAAGDPAAAREAMRAHLRRVTEDLLEATRLDLYERAQVDFDAHSARIKRRSGV